MAFSPMIVGGGGNLFDMLSALSVSDFITASDSESVSVTSGKHYLLCVVNIYTSSTSDISVSGATVVWETNVSSGRNNSRNANMEVALITATSNTITVTFAGGAVGRGYVLIPLD